MPVNRYTQVSPAKYNPLSFQEIAAVPLARRQQHDQAQAAADELAAIQAKRLQVDDPIVSGLIEGYQGETEAFVDDLTNQGVNPGTSGQLRALSRKRRELLSPTGDIGRAEANYNAVGAFRKEALNKVNSGEWSPQKAQAYVERQIGQFSTDGGNI